MAYDVPLSTRITKPVDLRLRMLAVLEDRSLNHLIDGLLDKVLPSADQLATMLRDGRPEQAASLETEEAVAVSTAEPAEVAA